MKIQMASLPATRINYYKHVEACVRTTVRMNHERLPRLSCYIVDDVTRPNTAYTEYSLIILSHIVLAKFSISLLTFHAN
jgi:hypothetical protein